MLSRKVKEASLLPWFQDVGTAHASTETQPDKAGEGFEERTEVKAFKLTKSGLVAVHGRIG